MTIIDHLKNATYSTESYSLKNLKIISVALPNKITTRKNEHHLTSEG